MKCLQRSLINSIRRSAGFFLHLNEDKGAAFIRRFMEIHDGAYGYSHIYIYSLTCACLTAISAISALRNANPADKRSTLL